MNRNKIILASVICFLSIVGVFSCKKNYELPGNNSKFENMDVSANFDWSTSKRIQVTVQVISENSSISKEDMENLPIDLADNKGNLLSRIGVKNGGVVFSIPVIASTSSIRISCPVTKDEMSINNINSSTQVEFRLRGYLARSGGKGAEPTITLALFDQDFQQTTEVLQQYGWEFWGASVIQHPTGKENDSVATMKLDVPNEWENEENRRAIISPKVKLGNTDRLSISFIAKLSEEIGGIQNLEFVLIGNRKNKDHFEGATFKTIGTVAVNKTEYTEYNVDLDAIPEDGAYQLAIVGRDSKECSVYIDNVLISNQCNNPDSDNDGVADLFDSFPEDPERAYAFSIPSSGYNYFLFEDLWPSTGDYDFNDLVLGTKTIYYLNAENEYIAGDAEMEVRAIGGSYPNSIGVQFLDSKSKTALPENTVTKFSGSHTSKDGSVKSTVEEEVNNANTAIIVHNVQENIRPFYANVYDDKLISNDIEIFHYSFRVNSPTTELIEPDYFIFQDSLRGNEIHVFGYPGTKLANPKVYGSSTDNTNPLTNSWYISKNNLPYAIKLWVSAKENAAAPVFYHPKSKVQINKAYPRFQAWAQSNGDLNKDWFLYPEEGLIFKR